MSESTSADDLTREYGAPFPLLSREEGSRYTSLLSRGYSCPRSLDFRLIDAYCRTLGFQKFVKMNHPAYHQLTLQFYTTLDFGGADTFSCRLMGKSVTVTRETLRDIFGFREGGIETAPRNFDPSGFWKEISDGRREFKGSRTPSGLIEDPLLLLMHKYVSHAVFGRSDASRVSTKNLLYLWCLRRGVLVSTPRFLVDTFKSVVASKRANMCLGNLITAIAVYFRAFDPSGMTMTVLRTRALSLALIMKTDMKEGKGKAEEARRNNYKCYEPPRNGFSGFRTGFDALEKKFNDMCARFQALQRDLKQGKSNYDKLSMRISRIEGDLFVNYNGERMSPENDIAPTAKNSPGTNNECVEPLGSAARDQIIEIPSDDETLPKGAAGTSKRVLGSEKMNFVLRKRNRTESMGRD